MKIELNDDEIRAALSAALAKAVDYMYTPKPEDLWFECCASEYEAGACRDISDMRVCWDTDP